MKQFLNIKSKLLEVGDSLSKILLVAVFVALYTTTATAPKLNIVEVHTIKSETIPIELRAKGITKENLQENNYYLEGSKILRIEGETDLSIKEYFRNRSKVRILIFYSIMISVYVLLQELERKLCK